MIGDFPLVEIILFIIYPSLSLFIIYSILREYKKSQEENQ